jgi:signal transduction histidine kinase
MACTDEMKLRQILLNLLSNAAKFTRGGKVSLRYRITPAWLEFSVQDTGIGIAPEAQSRIFEAFTQADSRLTRTYGGTGLGLAICRGFCERLGGSIQVQSAPDRGATFTVRLPNEARPTSAAI